MPTPVRVIDTSKVLAGQTSCKYDIPSLQVSKSIQPCCWEPNLQRPHDVEYIADLEHKPSNNLTVLWLPEKIEIALL